jgi:hypothetical protein
MTQFRVLDNFVGSDFAAGDSNCSHLRFDIKSGAAGRANNQNAVLE